MIWLQIRLHRPASFSCLEWSGIWKCFLLNLSNNRRNNILTVQSKNFLFTQLDMSLYGPIEGWYIVCLFTCVSLYFCSRESYTCTLIETHKSQGLSIKTSRYLASDPRTVAPFCRSMKRLQTRACGIDWFTHKEAQHSKRKQKTTFILFCLSSSDFSSFQTIFPLCWFVPCSKPANIWLNPSARLFLSSPKLLPKGFQFQPIPWTSISACISSHFLF